MKIKLLTLILGIFLINLVIAGNCEMREDIEWCCDDPDYLICKSGEDMCGINEDWCNNYLNNEASCDPDDESSCCADQGYVADVSGFCCPSNRPYYNSEFNACYPNPTLYTDNYFTRLSECYNYLIPGSQDSWVSNSPKCIGENYYLCEDNIKRIFQWNNQGKVIGKCGIIGIYRFENNACSIKNILESEKLSNDYNTLEDCEANIGSLTVSNIWLQIALGIIAIFIIGIIVLVIMGRKK